MDFIIRLIFLLSDLTGSC